MEIVLFETSPDSDRITVEADAAELDLHGDDYVFEGPVRIELHLNRNVDIVYAALTAQATLVLECARCLRSFRHDIEGSISFVVQRLKSGETAPQKLEEGEEEDEDNLIFMQYNARSIDITNFVRDALILSIPLKPVCDEQCKGLCQVCGENKNKRDCGCVEKKIDPRWQSLSKLKKNYPER